MKYLLGAFVGFIFTELNAQLPEYYVDLLKGEVLIQKGKQKAVALEPRSLVYNGDIIKIGKDGSEVTLVNKEALYFVLNKKGVYNVKDIIKLAPGKPEGVTEKYFHLLWEELLNPGKDFTKFKLENMVGSWGGVTRGSCDIKQFPVNKWVTSTDTICFKWRHTNKGLNYEFIFMDENANPVLQLFVRDTQIVLCKTGLVSSRQAVFYWSVNNVSDPCSELPRNKLVWLSNEEYQRQVKELIDPVKNEDKSHYYLEIAKNFTDKGFFELAAEYLKKAVLEKD